MSTATSFSPQALRMTCRVSLDHGRRKHPECGGDIFNGGCGGEKIYRFPVFWCILTGGLILLCGYTSMRKMMGTFCNFIQ